MSDPGAPTLPPIARWLGWTGLLPQVAVVGILLAGGSDVRFTALSLGFGYAALIYSFVGGVWWGLAAMGGSRTPRWVWVAAVVPTLVSLLSAWPWATGGAWPGPSLIVLALALLTSPVIDWRLRAVGLTPKGWMTLRVPLSTGLGLLTLAVGLLSTTQ